MKNQARLTLHCPDRPGLVAELSLLLHAKGYNITALDQYATEPQEGHFFLRIEFQGPEKGPGRSALYQELEGKAAEFQAEYWNLRFVEDRRKMAILASRTEHAPLELLWRWKNGELDADLKMVVSNHTVLQPLVESMGVPFVHVPVTPDTKPESERQILEHLGEDMDLMVLARYMQILSDEFVSQSPNRMINIHHSFLPAFVGANPYGRAFERGVKIIGATAHYVTKDLDEGPIIEQGVSRVTHRDSTSELKRRGKIIEREVLARAVEWHLEDRILVNGNKTVVFS